MIDYSEGCTELQRLSNAIWKAVVDERFVEARELCNELVVMARLTKAQITLQTRGE